MLHDVFELPILFLFFTVFISSAPLLLRKVTAAASEIISLPAEKVSPFAVISAEMLSLPSSYWLPSTET